MLIGRGIIALFTVLSLGGAIGGVDFVNRADIASAAAAVGSFLATPSTFHLFSYDRLLFFIVLIFISIVIFESVLNRNRPFTVLSSELRLQFLDTTGENLRVSRTQYLRANHPDVTAYYMGAWTSFGGTIPRDLVEVNAFAGDLQLTNHADIPPTVGASRLEITHVFDGGMPFTVWNLLIPEFILRFIVKHDLFKLPFIVRRELSFHYMNEHTIDHTYYEAAANRYVQRNVKIQISFQPGRPCALAGGVLPAQLLKRAGMKPFYFKNTGAYSHEYSFRKLQNETVRVPLIFK